MAARQLFISDLHLEESRPDISAALFDFLDRNHGKADELYILGDLFEVWIGDDSATELSNSVAAALNTFAKAGTMVYLMHGNRDFLLGDEYAANCGATLIHEPCNIDTAIGKVLLMHGDSLCTDDRDYQQFRQLVRSPAWQQEFLAKPLAERQAFADQARNQSKAATADKASAIMDVNQQAVEQCMSLANIKTLIHGHTHRPAVHNLPAQESQRVVLGDWDSQGWFGEINDAGLTLQAFSFSEVSG